MKRLCLFTIIILLAFHSSPQAAEKPQYTSVTFQDILSRVALRDETSDAILTVKSKDDCALQDSYLNFSIKQDRDGDIVIQLYVNNMINNSIYESYRLQIDNAMQIELDKQKRYQEVQEERAKEWQAKRAKDIEQLTGGKLKLGMTEEQVKAVKGEPVTTEQPVVQSILSDAIIWVYPDMKIYFQHGTLQDVEAVK